MFNLINNYLVVAEQDLVLHHSATAPVGDYDDVQEARLHGHLAALDDELNAQWSRLRRWAMSHTGWLEIHISRKN